MGDGKIINYYYRKNLKYLRKLNSYTQSELGEKMGVNYSTISRWERGDNDIDIEIATKLSRIFDVQAYHFMYTDIEFFTGEYRGFKPLFEQDFVLTNDDEKNLIENYRRLNSEYKNRLNDLMEYYLLSQKRRNKYE